MDIPMLEGEESTIASQLYSEGFKTLEKDRQKRFKKLLDYYNELTGFGETEANAIIHHFADMYGPDCENCGKPYRTHKASFCAACGNKRKMKKLFLDDVRTIEMVYDKSMESEFDIVRTYSAFVDYIKTNGLTNYISFDNDLGLGEDGKVAPDGLAAAKWLVYESGHDLRHLEFKVHSANPVAAEQIRGLLNNYIKHLKKLNESS
tara:strand:+ start:1978 stop:2592 length:615 start_codon:yes stop_codon:yes gene_type:complete